MDALFEFCQTLYNCTYLSINYYSNGTLKLSMPFGGDSLHIAEHFRDLLLAENRPIAYTITREFDYYGLVCDAERKRCVLIGPVINSRPSERSVINSMNTLGIPMENKPLLLELYQFLPLFTFHQFCSFLALFYREIYHEAIDIEAYLGLQSTQRINGIAAVHSQKVFETKEDENFHNTYYYEQQYLEYVRNGDAERLKEFFSQDVSLQEGRIADNSLRQAKNILIVSVTLATRQAILGGLDIEAAYQLSDLYIQEGEKLLSLDEIYKLQGTMLIDFTNRVAQTKIPYGTSPEISRCVQFIRQHTNRPITGEDVAEHIGKSRTHISRTFKKEMGVSMNEFIRQCKLEEAKMLLTYTDKTIGEISSDLCFSSQGYFQNMFKRTCGVTPNDYRKQSAEAATWYLPPH